MAFHLVLDCKHKLVEIYAPIPIDLHANLKLTQQNSRRIKKNKEKTRIHAIKRENDYITITTINPIE